MCFYLFVLRKFLPTFSIHHILVVVLLKLLAYSIAKRGNDFNNETIIYLTRFILKISDKPPNCSAKAEPSPT